MNYKIIAKTVGLALVIESALMIIPLILAIIYRESIAAFLAPILLLGFVGGCLFSLKPDTDDMFAREGFLIVTCAWVLLSFFGSLPFVISKAIPSIVDAFFETVSGFTTTGASILTNVEALPMSVTFWRSFTHWIGGMGILVFAMAVLPANNGRSMYVMRAEVPGPSVGKLVPRTRQTALYLYLIYIGMTLLMVIFLLFGGMNLFDSFITAFGTAGTGGFSNKAASIAAFDSAYIDWVVTLFMLAFSVNFTLYFLVLTKHPRQALRSEELRWFVIIVALATLLITLTVLPQVGNFGMSLRLSAFQVASVISTTGFATADFDLWPLFAKLILVLLMFIGACAGSTGGGLKVSRVVILVKRIRRECSQMLHPRLVRSVRFEHKAVESAQVHNVFAYVILYMLILFTATLVVSLDGFSFDTTFTAVLSCISNIGPGLGAVGPVGSFAGFSPFSKILLSVVMLLGRLEIYPMLLCFAPSMYRNNS